VNFQSSQAKQKQKFPPKFDKFLGCYNTRREFPAGAKVCTIGTSYQEDNRRSKKDGKASQA
jgi:hypothetical protein